MTETWEQRMSARAKARAAEQAAQDSAPNRAWDAFCRERGGWGSSAERLWHGHWRTHGNCIVSAVDGWNGGAFTVALTEEDWESAPVDPTEECPICRDVQTGKWSGE